MNANNQAEVRSTAESIYHSINMLQHQPQYPAGGNVRSPLNLDLINILTEDYLAGYMQDGRMSVVRRFFCLFVIFDLFFISLLWLICIMLTGQTIYDALKIQFIHYNIATSLIDVVIIAFFRCILLVFFYAIFYINHWCVIFITTTGSCGFLITKVFYYNWPAAAQPVFQVLLIIVSCVLAWGEAWFLDCRVIPKEKHAQRFFRAMMHAEHQHDERSPLIAPYMRSYAASRMGGESLHFYSPVESMNNSEDEQDHNEEYRSKSLDNVLKSYELLESTNWKLDKTTTCGDKIYYINRKPYGKVYRITADIEYPAKELFESLVTGVEQMPKWNPTLIESRVLRKIDDHLDITYQASAPSAGGLVNSRDFVNLRSWHVLHNGQITTIAEPKASGRDSPSGSSDASIQSFNHKNLRKSFSSTAIWDDDNDSVGEVLPATAPTKARMSFHTLSQSLGAKSFSIQNISKAQSDDAADTDAAGASTSHDAADTAEKTTNLLYLTSAVAVEYALMPPVAKYTRGENLVATWALRDHPSRQNVCVFEWLLCLDLKGYFPRYILDNAYTNVMQEFMVHLRRYSEGLPKRKSRESVCVAEVHRS